MGAVQQLWLLWGNQKEIRDLQNFRRCRAPEVPICELVDFTGFLLLCALSPGAGGVRMVKPVFRRKSIGTKVSDEEYARLEALAGGRAMSGWAREVLLRKLDGRQARPADETLLAEILALRTILLNAFYRLAEGEKRKRRVVAVWALTLPQEICSETLGSAFVRERTHPLQNSQRAATSEVVAHSGCTTGGNRNSDRVRFDRTAA
jgi:hypothetical protein